MSQALVSGKEVPDPPDLPGEILSNKYFAGYHQIPTGDGKGSYPWYKDPIDATDTIVAVVVFGESYGQAMSSGIDQVSTLLANALAKSNLIMVVGAAQAADILSPNGGFLEAATSQVTTQRVQQNCNLNAWPSCLGLHPRVLVVAPNELRSDGILELYKASSYLLGNSTVKIAAPGNPVPVVSPCVTDAVTATTPWADHDADGSSFAAPIVGLVLAKIIKDGEMQANPIGAIWRVLSTSRPWQGGPMSSEAKAVAFGNLDVARALRGVDTAAVGAEGRAQIYPRKPDDAGLGRAKPCPGSYEIPCQAVVVPYPWADDSETIALLANPNRPSQLRTPWKATRGYLTYSENDGNGQWASKAIDFSRVLSITRSASSTNGADSPQLFNLRYVETVTDAWDMAVVAKDGIQLGLEARSATGADGYCKLNGDSSGGAEALPACLYRWDPAATNPTDRFTPIDMSAVESIVLPPLHVAAMHVYGIRPSDLKKAIMRESPWHDELCRVRLRNATRKLLANKIPANADCRL